MRFLLHILEALADSDQTTWLLVFADLKYDKLADIDKYDCLLMEQNKELKRLLDLDLAWTIFEYSKENLSGMSTSGSDTAVIA